MSTYGYLAHHGVKGQKWGIRRYENPDGTLTEAGKIRYKKIYSYKNWKNTKANWNINVYGTALTAAALTTIGIAGIGVPGATPAALSLSLIGLGMGAWSGIQKKMKDRVVRDFEENVDKYNKEDSDKIKLYKEAASNKALVKTRQRDANGNPTTVIPYDVPEIRDYYNKILKDRTGKNIKRMDEKEYYNKIYKYAGY